MNPMTYISFEIQANNFNRMPHTSKKGMNLHFHVVSGERETVIQLWI
jgi:hypothetical protein